MYNQNHRSNIRCLWAEWSGSRGRKN